MKTLKQLILIIILSMQCYGQDQPLVSNKLMALKVSDSKLSFNQEISVYNGLKLYTEPQFGDLFENSFKQIQGVTNFNQFFNCLDLGLNFGLVHKLQRNLKLSGLCNFGMLRFRSYDVSKPNNYTIKVSLSYVF
ncbi:hypothetical protein [Gaetbulibacter saemankumensis]|uniref:hypothetical protein n=1 Tax=Gaetbulibacter saemankumensis TaxID=311208 RepID=UPI00041CA20C|nr:hypothetical protein [Gaetbulibacter saemankumensis]